MPPDQLVLRSLLFFPASRPTLLEKAVRTGADAVCMDLEDAVAPESKELARSEAIDLLATGRRGRARLALRINGLKSEAGVRDAVALCGADVMPDLLVLPKLESPEEVRWLEAILGSRLEGVGLIPMIETAVAVAAVDGIAVASPRVSALLFGSVDLAAELRIPMRWEALLYARSRVVNAAAMARVEVIDGPWVDIRDTDGLREESRSSAELGFGGKTAIHPTQVPVLTEVFSPSAAAIRAATELVAAYESAGGGVVVVNGKMVEKPSIQHALRTLRIAGTLEAERDPPP